MYYFFARKYGIKILLFNQARIKQCIYKSFFRYERFSLLKLLGSLKHHPY